MNHFIALSKGELGKEIEKYLSIYGLNIKLDGRPLTFVQKNRNITFRPMQSKDVPWYVSERADYGIVGEDLLLDYNLSGRDSLKPVERLGFGKGDLVIFAKYEIPELKRKTSRVLVVAVPRFYRNLLASGSGGNYLKDILGEFETREVEGSTEGFVADGTADLGFDFTTYFIKTDEEKGRTTISTNGLRIIDRIMPTEAVVISKNSSDYSMEDFQRILIQESL